MRCGICNHTLIIKTRTGKTINNNENEILHNILEFWFNDRFLEMNELGLLDINLADPNGRRHKYLTAFVVVCLSRKKVYLKTYFL